MCWNVKVIQKFKKTYDKLWPAGPGAEDQTQTVSCYMCRYFRECGKRACNGNCCRYCLKSPIAQGSGRLSLSEADVFFREAEAKLLNDTSDTALPETGDSGKVSIEE
ncbi:hypothetical protein CBR_g70804 [Chara braunii]|uniref:Uncharacterized protein n=1 Tax=Chara braunii TaxID=69332 RepID=A0A388MFV4_CHABU|nr:hypothetical protein CBR_g70804 [Chara braunii]|eukprot:GBG93458.1 hypothetical protein CBR_g70804 [Chara braunii]